MLNYSNVKKVILLSSLILVSGCNATGGENVSDKLKVANSVIADLEVQNKALKDKVADLKDQLKEVKTAKSEQKIKVAALNKNEFTDLEEANGRKFIEQLAGIGVFNDFESNKFEPLKKLSRGEFIKWTYKAYNAVQKNEADKLRLAPQLEQQFSDLRPENPYYKYAQALANAGYSVGYTDGTFKPDQAITREEMIGIKVGIDYGKSIKPDRMMMAYEWKFSDSKNVDDRFTGYIYQDCHTGGPPYGCNIQRAFGKIGTFKPKQAVLRSEAASCLWAFGRFSNISKTTAGYALDRQMKIARN